MRELIRTVRFRPYLKNKGPRFTLQLFDTGRTDRDGKCVLGYRLSQHTDVYSRNVTCRHEVLFEGEDFRCSPLHAIDSDETVKSLMGFLTLRKGDTDAEYFKDYTDAQLAFSEQHAEYLNGEVHNRFGWED